MATKKKSRNSGVRSPDAETAAVIGKYSPTVQRALLALRKTILETAAETAGVGRLKETLKWNEPAFVTEDSKSGSTIRINGKKGSDSKYSLYFNCNTTLVDSFRTLFPQSFRYVDNREIEFDTRDKIAVRDLKTCISMALTYHLKKKQ